MANGRRDMSYMLQVRVRGRLSPTTFRLSPTTLSLTATLNLLFLTGCQPPQEKIRIYGTRTLWQSQIIAHSVENRPIEMLSAGSGPETVLIIATIHGNESAGTPLLYRLADELSARPDLLHNRRVLLIPVVNPDGYARHTRHNKHNVDLNRNFPADNYQTAGEHGRAALCEPESQALHEILKQHHPARIVSIHQPLVCIDYDGPAADLAAAMGAVCELPVKKLGGRPGSLGSYAGETLKIPIITVELVGSDSQLDTASLWDKYGRMLLSAITFPQSPGVLQ
jgi:protein MpaA